MKEQILKLLNEFQEYERDDNPCYEALITKSELAEQIAKLIDTTDDVIYLKDAMLTQAKMFDKEIAEAKKLMVVKVPKATKEQAKAIAIKYTTHMRLCTMNGGGDDFCTCGRSQRLDSLAGDITKLLEKNPHLNKDSGIEWREA